MSSKLGYLLGFALTVACGPTEHGSPATTGGSSGASSADTSASAGRDDDGGHSGAAGASGGGSSGPGGGGSAGTAGGSAAQKGATGSVQFGRLFLTSASQKFETSARFSSKDAVHELDCDQQAFGDCYVSTCKQHDGAPTPSPNAGIITVSDGNMIDVSLAPTAGKDYASMSASTGVVGGEQITATASGGEVPAFTATVAVPLVITISSPELDTKGVGNAPRSADLSLVFDNRAGDGETGTRLMVQSLSSANTDAKLYCDFASESGKAVIPAEALSKLAQGSKLLLLTTRTKQVQAGDFDVAVIAYISAMNPAKSGGAVVTLN